MVARKPSTQGMQDRPPVQADVVTPAPMTHGSDYLGFIWQQLGEINKTLGRLEAGQNSLGERLAKVEDKTSKTKDKVDKIIWVGAGAGATVGIIASVSYWVIKALSAT